MFNSISLENQAFYLSRYIYRDTKIETYHQENVALSMELYKEMIGIVHENIRKVQRYHNIMLALQTEKDVDTQLPRMSPAERNEFILYVSYYNFLSKCLCNWNPPEKIEMLSLPQDLSAFILDGHFRECCNKHSVLTDPVMCYINKDVYNRIYTLMCENILP